MFDKLLRDLRLRYRTSRFTAAFSSPRKPRHPLLRLILGLAGLMLLSVLLAVGLVVGAAMLAGGLLLRALRGSGPVRGGNAGGATIDGDFRVVERTLLR